MSPCALGSARRGAAALVAALVVFPASGSACEPGPGIVANPGRYGSYYHRCLALGARMIDFEASDRVASSGGQFEVRLHRETFPIAAPACQGSIILRMPWTAPGKDDYAAKVEDKRRLLARIRELERSDKALLPVVVELVSGTKLPVATPSFKQLPGTFTKAPLRKRSRLLEA